MLCKFTEGRESALNLRLRVMIVMLIGVPSRGLGCWIPPRNVLDPFWKFLSLKIIKNAEKTTFSVTSWICTRDPNPLIKPVSLRLCGWNLWDVRVAIFLTAEWYYSMIRRCVYLLEIFWGSFRVEVNGCEIRNFLHHGWCSPFLKKFC